MREYEAMRAFPDQSISFTTLIGIDGNHAIVMAEGPIDPLPCPPFPHPPQSRDFGQIQHTHPTLRLRPGRTARPDPRSAVHGPISALFLGLSAASATDGALDPLEPHHNPSPHFRPKLPFDSTVTAHDTGDMPPNVPFQRRLPRHQTEAQTPVTTTTR